MNRKSGAYFTKKRSKSLKRTFKRHGILIANATLIVALTGFVWVGHNSASSDTPKSFSLINQSSNNVESAPLDTLSSADIAANIALAVSLPEEVMVVNQADSYKAQLEKTTTEESVVTKPQIVTGAAASLADIVPYTTQEGDTLSTLADKFGISADTIRWSNSITGGETLTPGTKLKIPPQNGVLIKAKSGDTADSLATKYSASKAKIVAFNDLETTSIKKDDDIFIPGGKQPVAPVYSAPSSGSSLSTYGFVARYGGNGYSYGYCTWYAANRVAVPNNWGNANTWDNYARSSGWTVSSVPKPGAVAQTDAMSWWGHVAVVEEVSADGTQMRYSDMNGLAGWNRVGYSGWVSSSTFQNYIYR